MKYTSFKYYYPPRPSNAAPIADIDGWDDGSLLSQLKFNGSNCSIYTDGSVVHIMNRHGQRLTNFRLSREEVLELYKNQTPGSWLVINAEYLNKNKNDERGLPFNHKLVVFDILVLNSEYLVGSTFEERVNTLDNLYGNQESDKEYLWKISDNIYRVKTYLTGFKELFDKWTVVDVIEGLVCKRKGGRLEIGLSQNNTTRNQVKFRKSTKNYKY